MIPRVSEASTQMVVRVAPIAPNAASTPVTVTYDSGGLTVTPSSPQTIIATPDFATTGSLDYTITRDVIGGTQRRVTFTCSATGYVSTTDGVDVIPNSTRFNAKVNNSANQSIANNTSTVLTWDSEFYDNGSLHSTSSLTSRITIPAGGDIGNWLLFANVEWAANATGYRELQIIKNGANIMAFEREAGFTLSALGNVQSVTGLADYPAVADYFEVRVVQTSGGPLNVLFTLSWFSMIHVW